MTLYQHFALEGVALHRIGAGVEQIGVAAEDLAVPEKNHAAALARTSVEQADVDRIQPVLHRLPDATVPGRRAPLPFCQTRCHGVNAPGWPLVSLGAWWVRNCVGDMTPSFRDAPLGRRPGIQHHALFWIPGSRRRGAPRNDGLWMDARVKPAHDDARLTHTSCRAPAVRRKCPAARG